MPLKATIQIRISGPAASGKSLTAHALATHLAALGLAVSVEGIAFRPERLSWARFLRWLGLYRAPFGLADLAHSPTFAITTSNTAPGGDYRKATATPLRLTESWNLLAECPHCKRAEELDRATSDRLRASHFGFETVCSGCQGPMVVTRLGTFKKYA